MLEIDNLLNDKYINENSIKKALQLPKTIKISLEKGKLLIDKKWDDNNLNSYIYDFIKIENKVKNINTINEIINKCNKNKKINIEFSPKNEQLEGFYNSIKSFGKVLYNKKNIHSDNVQKTFRKIGNIQ